MPIGNLYRFDEEQFLTKVTYRLLGEEPKHLWGELVPTENVGVIDGGDYLIKLEDNRKVRCSLKKNVNRGVTGIPPRFVYRFMGTAIPA